MVSNKPRYLSFCLRFSVKVTAVTLMNPVPGVSHSTVVRGLKSIGKVQKLGRWVLHDLTQHDMDRRADVALSLLTLRRTDGWLDNLVTGDEERILYSNYHRRAQWVDATGDAEDVPKHDIHVKKMPYKNSSWTPFMQMSTVRKKSWYRCASMRRKMSTGHLMMTVRAKRDANTSVRYYGNGLYESIQLPETYYFGQDLPCQVFSVWYSITREQEQEHCFIDEYEDIFCYCNTDFCTSNFTRLMELWKESKDYNASLERSKCLEKNAKVQEAYIRRVQGLPPESDEEATTASTLSASQPVTSTTVKPETTTGTKAGSSTTSPEKLYAETDSAESSKIYADKAKKVASDTAILPIVISVVGDLLIIIGGLLFWLYERQKYMETHKAQGQVVKERSESLLTASKISPYKSKMAEPYAKQMSAEPAHKETETAAKGTTSKKSLPAGGSAEDQPRTRKKRSRGSPCVNRVPQKLLKIRMKRRRICHQLKSPRNRDPKNFLLPNRYGRS